MTNQQKKIATKIQALLAKASSTEHEAEATAFMAKAQQLLEEHQIDLGTLQDAGDPVQIHRGLERTAKDPTWHKKLYAALGMMYGCKVVYSPKYVRGHWGFQIELTGRESAFVTTELMYPWIKSQCEAQGRTLAKAYPELSASQHTRRVANALAHRIYLLTAQERRQERPKTEAATANALVTQDRVLQVFNEHYGDNLKSSRASSGTTNRAARDAASKIGLHRQAGGSSQLKLGSR
jgi:hypothetical protein